MRSNGFLAKHVNAVKSQKNRPDKTQNDLKRIALNVLNKSKIAKQHQQQIAARNAYRYLHTRIESFAHARLQNGKQSRSHHKHKWQPKQQSLKKRIKHFTILDLRFAKIQFFSIN